MEIGRLRTPIDLYRKVTTRAADGQPVEDYLRYATGLRAEIKSRANGEIQPGQLTAAAYTHVFKIWYRRDVRPTDRIVTGGITYEVNGRTDPNNGQRQFLEILTTEIQ